MLKNFPISSFNQGNKFKNKIILGQSHLKFLTDIYHDAVDMMVIANPYTGFIIDCNKSFLKRLEYSYEEALNLNLFHDIYHPECHDKVTLGRQYFLQHHSLESYEFYFRTKTGAKVPVFANASPIFNEDNQLYLAWGTFRDMTEIFEAHEKLERINGELHKRNEDLNTILHLITHDLKSPLRGINLISQWFIEDEGSNLSPASQRYLQSLSQRVNRAQSLLDDITQYFFHPAQDNILEEIGFSFMQEEFNNRLYIPVGFQIILEGAPQQFYTKKTPLLIILSNLIDNAIKHHHQPHKGKVIIKVEELENAYRFMVTDNGPGIAPAYHEYIFGFFNKLKSRDQVEGSGLGLSIVRKLVHLEKGTIEVSSQEGAGATFSFIWPKMEESPQTVSHGGLENKY